METALRLKRLRERSGFSVRKFAAEIGMDASRYAYFEDAARFKKPHIPMAMAKQIAPVVADRGIAPNEVMALAGVEDELPKTLSRGEEAWLLVWRALTPGQRRLAMDQLCCSLGWMKPEGEPDYSCVFKNAA